MFSPQHEESFKNLTSIRDKINLQYISRNKTHLMSKFWKDGLGLNSFSNNEFAFCTIKKSI